MSLGEPSAGADVDRGEVHVVDPLHRGATRGGPGRLVQEHRRRFRRRHVVLGLEVELDRMPVGSPEHISRALPFVPVVPGAVEPGRLEPLDGHRQCVGADRSERDMRDARRRVLGDLEAIALVVPPPAQIRRTASLSDERHPEEIGEERHRRGDVGREDLDVAQVGSDQRPVVGPVELHRERLSHTLSTKLASRHRGRSPSWTHRIGA